VGSDERDALASPGVEGKALVPRRAAVAGVAVAPREHAAARLALGLHVIAPYNCGRKRVQRAEAGVRCISTVAREACVELDYCLRRTDAGVTHVAPVCATQRQSGREKGANQRQKQHKLHSRLPGVPQGRACLS
jgi:hypothetical protein